MPTLQVKLLGPPLIQRLERPVEVKERKAMALLAYLALSPNVRGRDELAVLLWPEHPKSRDRLRHALWAARKAIGEESLIVEREFIGLRQDESVSIDVLEFRRLLSAHLSHGHTAQEVCHRCLEPLTAAVCLYRGDFLAGFTLAGSQGFDDWQTFQSESLRQELGDVLGRLVRLHSKCGEFEQAIEYGRRRLALDPLHEPAQRELMRLYAWAGRSSVALRHYGDFEALLDEEIGVSPDQETIDLAEAIRRGLLEPPKPITGLERAEALPSVGGLLEQRGVVRNLPGILEQFIGRRREIDELVRLLREEPNCRLLTLIGLGGVGKTALAIQAAIEAAASFERGAVFVPLVEVEDDAHLPLVIAGALRIPIRGLEEPKAQLINVLRDRELLLVLDNFEQLLGGGASGLLAELLAGSSRLKLLVTSRERLKLSEEWGYELSGLLYPDPDIAGAESLEEYSAIQLFLQIARRARPHVELTGENRSQVLRICRLVDGLPLALKLAAPWSRIMTFRQIADEVESNLGFLESTLRDIPDRHRNIRAVFTHSWALLSDDERESFMKLSVFRGGFSRQAAEQVAGASLPMLLRLADKSLIQRGEDGRFQVHELLRRYASDRLMERPHESNAARDAHAGYFATYLSRREESIRGLRQEQILAELTAESDNIRAAWNRACDSGDLTLLGKSAECLVHFYHFVDRIQEGRALCGQGVASVRNVSVGHDREGFQKGEYDLALSMLLLGQGFFVSHLGSQEEAQSLIERGFRLLKRMKPVPRRRLAMALCWLGQTYIFLGDYTKALELYYESLKIHQEIGDKNGQGYTSMHIGMTESYHGNYRLGREYLRIGTRLLEEVGNRRILVICMWLLGSIARTMGDFEKARQRLEDSLHLAQSHGMAYALTYILREISQLELELGNYDDAQKWLEQGLKPLSEAGFQRLEGFFHLGLGVVARRRCKFEEAGQRFETGMALFRASNEPRGVGLGLQNMGDLAVDERRFADAERLYQESLSRFEAIENRLGVASALCSLGVAVAVDPQQHPLAREYFQRSLDVSTEIGATPVRLDALVGLASLASAEVSTRELAAEWLALVLIHPAGKFETKERARKLMANLAKGMEQERLDGAIRRGEARELDEILMGASALDHSFR